MKIILHPHFRSIPSGLLILVFSAFLIVIDSGCASSYRKISPVLLEYTKGEKTESIDYGYHFNVLANFQNKKYAKKAEQGNIKIVAFEITNVSNRKFDLVNDVEYIQQAGIKIKPMEPDSAYRLLELKPRKYLPLLFFSAVNYYWIEEIGPPSEVKSYFRMIPVGIVIAPILTMFDVETVKLSNLSLAADLDLYSPYSNILPGQKKYILIPFKDISEMPIQMKIRTTGK